MKRNEWMALIVTTFLMFAICLSASAKGKKNVERGMTKQEVIAILGQPKLTSFDAYGDRWDYSKTNVLTGENKQITVGFDLNGRVVAYNTRLVDDNTSNGAFNNRNDIATGNCQPPIPPYGAGPDAPFFYGYCLDDASFKQLKVLSMMASRIVDPQNAIVIYNVLTFDSEKSKAGEIMRNARRY